MILAGGDRYLVNQNSIQSQRPGWSWPRFPWQRSDNQRFRQTPSSPDSQYGFSTNMSRLDNSNMMQSYTLINNPHHFGTFSWGPPPPYSDPNSPLRRNRYLYNQCQQITEHGGMVIQPISTVSHQPNMAAMDCNQPMVSENHHSIEQICATPTHSNHRIKNRLNAFKPKDSTESATLSDSDTQRESSTHSNTLPFRKARKKIENGAKSIGSNQSTSRVNVQNIFSSTQNMSVSGRLDNNGRMHDNRPSCSSNFVHSKVKNATNVGVENSGFQSMEEAFPNREYEKFSNLNAHMQHYSPVMSRNHSSSHSLPKDLTRYSICSAESEKTEYTDVSPMTPMTPMNDDSNAIALAFQREMKNQQRLCKDRSVASGSNSNSTPTYSARYLESGNHSSNITRPKNVPEIHLRSTMQHMMSINNGASLDNLNTPTTLYQQVERKSVYQRPTYSFASGHSTSGHSHNNTNPKHNLTTTPKKRNIYATHSLGSPSNLSNMSGDIDLVRLTNMRKETKGDDGHSKTLNENDWPDLNNDRRL